MGVIAGWVLRTLAWLAPALALWYWLREALVAPVAWLAERAMMGIFPGWVYGVGLEGTTATLRTILKVPTATGGFVELAPAVAVLPYCYGLPLLAALLAATGWRGLWWKLPLGTSLLWPLQAFGLCFNWLVSVSIYSGDAVRAATGFSATHANLFALGFQFGYLIFPSTAPFLLWLWLERDSAARLIGRGGPVGLRA